MRRGAVTARHILDTPIVSEVVKPRPCPALLDWLGAQPEEAVQIFTLTLGAIHRGPLEKAPGGRRRELATRSVGPEGPQRLFAARVLPFEERAALAWRAGRAANVAGDADRQGRCRHDGKKSAMSGP